MDSGIRQILVFLVGALVWVAIALAAFVVWRMRRPRPAALPAGILFHESFVSGSSHKNAFTRHFVVSHNTASVTVTPGELIIASPVPVGDLNHRAPRAGVRATVGRTAFGHTSVTVEFDAESGGRRAVELALRDASGFVAALGAVPAEQIHG
jgi:hypothetical protein